MRGHLWTIAPYLRGNPRALCGEPFELERGERLLSGRVSTRGASWLVLLHGLGGEVDNFYMREAMGLAQERGYRCLSMAVPWDRRRGWLHRYEGFGEDLRHCLDQFGEGRAVALGFSLGALAALREVSAAQPVLEAVIGLCAPLDEAGCVEQIDSRAAWLYRAALLRWLRELDDRRRPPQRAARVQRELDRCRSVERWQALTEQRAAALDLGALGKPCLLYATRQDPMVPAELIESIDLPDGVELCWRDGGHLSVAGQSIRGWMEEALDWLEGSPAVLGEGAGGSDV